MARFVRFRLASGADDILVNVKHITHAVTTDEGVALMLTGTEGDSNGEHHPVFVLVAGTLEEVEQLLAADQPTAKPRQFLGIQMGGGT